MKSYRCVIRDEQGIEYHWIIPYNKLHRTDGPAYKFLAKGYMELAYLIEGDYHRYNGPAYFCFYTSTKKITSEIWYLNGNKVDKNTYLEWLSEMGMDIKNLSDNDKTLIDLKWSIK